MPEPEPWVRSLRMRRMRVALVSPYSWTYPGGVTRHIEALAGELDRAGHDVKVLAPFDPDRRRTAWLHRGARPQVREIPEWPVLLRAFEALRREVPAELVVIGSTLEELAPLLVDGEGVTALGRIDDAAKE